jgi:hypothetical protein
MIELFKEVVTTPTTIITTGANQPYSMLFQVLING